MRPYGYYFDFFPLINLRMNSKITAPTKAIKISIRKLAAQVNPNQGQDQPASRPPSMPTRILPSNPT